MRVKFSECIELCGKSVNEYKGEKQYISTSAVNCNFVDETQIEKFLYKDKPSRANLQVEENSVIFAKMQNTKKTLIINKELSKNIYSTGFFAVKPKNNILTVDCLFYLLNSEYFLKLKDKNCSGATQKAITNEGLEKIEIKIPKKEEQEFLIKKLNNLENTINLYQSQLQNLDLLIKSRFVEMFGDIENTKFKIDKLGNFIKVKGGYAFKSSEFQEEGIPVLRIGNINSGHFKEINMVYWKEDKNLEDYLIYPKDLVISLTGTTGKDDYGNVCIIGNEYEKYYLNQRNAKIVLGEKINAYYLSYLLKEDKVKKKLTSRGKGVRQANISNKDIETLQIPIPPVELQNDFASCVEQVDKSKFAVQKALEKTKMLMDSLMQEYFG